MTRLLLIVGSTVFSECPRGLAQLDRHFQALMQDLSRTGGIIVTGGSVGAEVQAEMLAITFGVNAVAYRPDGTRRFNGSASGRWTESTLPTGAAAVVARDHVLIQRATLAHRERRALVEVHAFLDAAAKPRSSSLQRVQMAESAGLPVIAQRWSLHNGFFRPEVSARAA